jgi:hypothetical protein
MALSTKTATPITTVATITAIGLIWMAR